MGVKCLAMEKRTEYSLRINSTIQRYSKSHRWLASSIVTDKKQKQDARVKKSKQLSPTKTAGKGANQNLVAS